MQLLEYISQHQSVINELPAIEDKIDEFISCVVEALTLGNKILFCGNGGSAADCQHLAAEFSGRFVKDRKALAALALTVDTSMLTCIANDYSYQEVFSRQIESIGKPGDVLVAISTSGNSRNVIRAVNTAKKLGITTVGLLGRNGGELLEVCDVSLVVPSMTTSLVQESHIFLGHYMCYKVEEVLGFSNV